MSPFPAEYSSCLIRDPNTAGGTTVSKQLEMTCQQSGHEENGRIIWAASERPGNITCTSRLWRLDIFDTWGLKLEPDDWPGAVLQTPKSLNGRCTVCTSPCLFLLVGREEVGGSKLGFRLVVWQVKTLLPHVQNLIYKLFSVFFIYHSFAEAGQEVTLWEMNSISCNYSYFIQVGVTHGRATNPSTALLPIHFSMHVIDVL